MRMAHELEPDDLDLIITSQVNHRIMSGNWMKSWHIIKFKETVDLEYSAWRTSTAGKRAQLGEMKNQYHN